MGKISLEQAGKLNSGGGKYFSLKADESKQVRFLWDRWEEVGNDYCYGVHEVSHKTADGQIRWNTIDCPKTSDPNAHCKYCNGEVTNHDGKRSGQVGRIIIPLYNIEEDCIQYWKKSDKWVTGTLKPVLDEAANMSSIANQTYKIKRTGNGLDTTYSVIPVLNASDNRTKKDFGEIEDPYKLNMILNYDANNQAQGQVQTQNQPQPSQDYQPRRTTEVF